MNENEQEKEWRLNVEKNDIRDVTYINMNEIEYEIDVEEIIKE
jgi:hypothetical protein